MDQVEKLCDSIALISRGKLLPDGSMREIKSELTANRVQVVFSGTIRFLTHPGVVERRTFGHCGTEAEGRGFGAGGAWRGRWRVGP